MTFHEIITSDPRAGARACHMVKVALGILKPNEYSYRDIDLLDSLDAWRPLWERIFKNENFVDMFELYFDNLLNQQGSTLEHVQDGTWSVEEFGEFLLLAKPHHHLEAALRTLEVECPECGGDYKSYNPSYPDCTCTDGKRTLYEIWEREVSNE